MVKGIKVKLSENLEVNVELNKRNLFFCRLSIGHISSTLGTSEGINLKQLGPLLLLLLQPILPLLLLQLIMTAKTTTSDYICDYLRLPLTACDCVATATVAHSVIYLNIFFSSYLWDPFCAFSVSLVEVCFFSTDYNRL